MVPGVNGKSNSFATRGQPDTATQPNGNSERRTINVNGMPGFQAGTPNSGKRKKPQSKKRQNYRSISRDERFYFSPNPRMKVVSPGRIREETYAKEFAATAISRTIEFTSVEIQYQLRHYF